MNLFAALACAACESGTNTTHSPPPLPDGAGGNAAHGGSSAVSGGTAGSESRAGSGASAGDSSEGAGAAGTAGAAQKPTLESQFASDDGIWTAAAAPGGKNQFGEDNTSAVDNAVVSLLFPGDPNLTATDKVSPKYATEIETKQRLSFGVYRGRLQLARCSPNEEVVNGFFTYFNDGNDHDDDGLIDNSELDIEILCDSPAIISLTVWSEYTSDDAFVKMSRWVDLSSGDVFESNDDHSYGGKKVAHLPEFKHPSFPDPEAFYEMGFDWQPTSVRFFIVLDNQELTLWDFRESQYIPKLDAHFIFNVWHPRIQWWTGLDGDYPQKDAIMRVDWFRYWKR